MIFNKGVSNKEAEEWSCYSRVAQKCKKSWNQAFVLILHTQHLPKHRNMNIFHFKAFYAERRPLEGNRF